MKFVLTTLSIARIVDLQICLVTLSSTAGGRSLAWLDELSVFPLPADSAGFFVGRRAFNSNTGCGVTMRDLPRGDGGGCAGTALVKWSGLAKS
ncbi:hypothetical protein ACYJW8_04105 [Frateuria aurantia]